MALVLDGCCGAGGAARGYVQAGHQVRGVDIGPQPNYLNSGAAGFTQASILDVLADAAFIASFAFIHVSPPCQRHSRMSSCRPRLAGRYPALIEPVRELLMATGKPWVIENVEAAPLTGPVTLSGQMFGRLLYRHRLFEAGGGFTLAGPLTPAADMPGARKSCGWPHPVRTSNDGHWTPGTIMLVAAGEARRRLGLPGEPADRLRREGDRPAGRVPPRRSRGRPRGARRDRPAGRRSPPGRVVPVRVTGPAAHAGRPLPRAVRTHRDAMAVRHIARGTAGS